LEEAKQAVPRRELSEEEKSLFLSIKDLENDPRNIVPFDESEKFLQNTGLTLG